jgi:hypothetical protein
VPTVHPSSACRTAACSQVDVIQSCSPARAEAASREPVPMSVVLVWEKGRAPGAGRVDGRVRRPPNTTVLFYDQAHEQCGVRGDACASMGSAPSASASAPGGSPRRVQRTRSTLPPSPPPPASSGGCRTPQSCRASACRSGSWAARTVPREPPSTNLAARTSAPQARRGEIRNDGHVRACSVRERNAGREGGG